MNKQNHSIILFLIDAYSKKEKPCTYVHLQKIAYIAKNFSNIPLDMGFVLYKQGMHSFDLDYELENLRIAGLIKIESHTSCANSISVSNNGERLMDADFPKEFSSQLTKIVQELHEESIQSLENLTLVLYLKEKYPQDTKEATGARLRKIKQHVSEDDAFSAIERMEAISEVLQVQTEQTFQPFV